MGGNNGVAAVPVKQTSTPVKLAGGGTAWVRRLKRSEKTDLMSAASFDGGVAGAARLAELTVRAAVTAVQDLDDEDGNPLKLARKPHPSLGLIATRELWDAIDSADVETIMAAANETLSREQQGNCEPPPGGSTPGGGN